MDTVPRDVIECAILDGQMPQYGDGAEWCEQHGSCYRCAKDIHDMMVEEIRRLKAERDRALAELDKALGEREDAVAYWQEASYKDGYDEGFASADDLLAQHEDVMAEHGWVRMPEDADGRYWFCGDKIMLPDGNVVEIIGIGGDWLYYCVASVAITVFGRIRAHDKHHYEQPTVEDVLREFTDAILEWSGKSGTVAEVGTWSDVAADFAAKLQLRGDAE